MCIYYICIIYLYYKYDIIKLQAYSGSFEFEIIIYFHIV